MYELQHSLNDIFVCFDRSTDVLSRWIIEVGLLEDNRSCVYFHCSTDIITVRMFYLLQLIGVKSTELDLCEDL